MDTDRNIKTQTQPVETENFLQSLEYRVARSRQDLVKAYNLVYREYLKRDYIPNSESQMKLSLYNALPQTTTFMATFESEPVATATIIPDSPLMLPMDSIYHEELNAAFRDQGKKICEISMLASDTDLFNKETAMMLNSKKLILIFYLFKTIFDYSRDVLKLDAMCITVNPKHSLTYDFLLFKDFGGLKTYHNANDAPAIAKYLDLNRVEEECKLKNKTGLVKVFFGEKTNPEKLAGKVALTADDLHYFFVQNSPCLKTAPSGHIAYIKSCYPDYNFEEIIDRRP